MKNKDTGTHYRFTYKGIKLDPIRIGLIYGITHPAQHGALKKILCAGQRGKKSLREDIEDIICGCERWLETLDEDEKDMEPMTPDSSPTIKIKGIGND